MNTFFRTIMKRVTKQRGLNLFWEKAYKIKDMASEQIDFKSNWKFMM